MIKACIDRRNGWFGALDCEPGYNTLNLEIIEVCKTSNADLYPECDTGEDEEPVDPDVTADEEEEPDLQPEPIILPEDNNSTNSAPYFAVYDRFEVYEVFSKHIFDVVLLWE